MLDAIARERGPSRRRRLKLGGRNWSPRVLVPAGLAAVALIVAAIALTGGEEQAPAPAYQVQLRPTPGSAARGSAALDSVSGRHLAQAGHPGPAARPRHGLRGRVRRPQGHRERRHLPRRRQGPRLRGPHHRRAPRRVRRHPRRPPPQAARVRRPDRHPELGARHAHPHPARPRDWCSRWPAAAGRKNAGGGGGASASRARRRWRRASSSRWPRPTDGALKFDKTALTAKAGKVTINFDNPSSVPARRRDRGQRRRGGDGRGHRRQDVADARTSRPATYEFYCPVANHREAGMEGTLTVK